MCTAQFSWQYLGKWWAKIECVRHDISPKQCHCSVQGVSSELWSHSNSNYHCIWWAEQCIQPKAYQNYTYNNSSQELCALQSLKEEPTNLNPNLELQLMMVFVTTRQIIRLVYTIVRFLLLCSPILGTATVSTVTSAYIVPWHHKQKPFPFNLLVTSSKSGCHIASVFEVAELNTIVDFSKHKFNLELRRIQFTIRGKTTWKTSVSNTEKKTAGRIGIPRSKFNPTAVPRTCKMKKMAVSLGSCSAITQHTIHHF